jgi:hypothetical protein
MRSVCATRATWHDDGSLASVDLLPLTVETLSVPKETQHENAPEVLRRRADEHRRIALGASAGLVRRLDGTG